MKNDILDYLSFPSLDSKFKSKIQSKYLKILDNLSTLSERKLHNYYNTEVNYNHKHNITKIVLLIYIFYGILRFIINNPIVI